MKKQLLRISFTGLLMFNIFQLSAQVSISNDAAGADNSAMLEVRPPVPKGVLLPHLSQAQMHAIDSPTNGLLLFCVTDNKFYTYIAAENVWRDLKYGPDTINVVPHVPVTTVLSVQAVPGTTIAIPVKVTGFYNIGSISLTLLFNAAVLTYLGGTNDSGFPGLVSNSPSTGKIVLGGISTNAGITLPDNSTLFTINFHYAGGSSSFTWWDSGVSCEYTGPPPSYTVLPDTPQSVFYINGSVNPHSQP